jgi:CBS domain-containing protein
MGREEKFSSYVGDGVAIPHTRVDGVHRIHLGLLTSLGGFDAQDSQENKAIHLLFIILTPPDKNTLMLQTLAAVARLCRTKDIRESLRRTKTPSRIIKQIEEIGIDVKSTITAADVMQEPPPSLQPEMTLKEAIERIIDQQVDGLPVTDGQGKLLGELTSLEVLKIGLPKYVDILKDDSFLTQFEPFEDYFQREEALKVREVMTRDMATAEEDTPIIKIANMLVSNNKNCAYVTRDGKLNGVVYRRELLSRVLQV